MTHGKGDERGVDGERGRQPPDAEGGERAQRIVGGQLPGREQEEPRAQEEHEPVGGAPPGIERAERVVERVEDERGGGQQAAHYPEPEGEVRGDGEPEEQEQAGLLATRAAAQEREQRQQDRGFLAEQRGEDERGAGGIAGGGGAAALRGPEALPGQGHEERRQQLRDPDRAGDGLGVHRVRDEQDRRDPGHGGWNPAGEDGVEDEGERGVERDVRRVEGHRA